MIPDLRREYNGRQFSPQNYSSLLEALERRTGAPVGFRHNETPVFLPAPLVETMTAATVEMLSQTLEEPYHTASSAIIPAEYWVPGEPGNPLFVQADFGLVETADGIQPRLVEIQGFPSLYAYQAVLSSEYSSAYGIDPELDRFPGKLGEAEYFRLLGEAILAGHSPENVVLLDIFPDRQKTRCDFVVTQQITGIPTVCVTKVIVDGTKLFYESDGRRVPIHRIYNRCIVDELERLGVKAPFDWNAPLDVEWAGHPNWYFRLSKFTLPFLRHPFVPRSLFLDRLQAIPEDLENWVLKPLYSFAGTGVSVGPTRQQIESVAEPAKWILQERIRWQPVIETPHGMTQMEIRVMMIWPDGGPPRPVNTIIRTGRGKMMGVDYNKGLEWVGASAAFIR